MSDETERGAELFSHLQSFDSNADKSQFFDSETNLWDLAKLETALNTSAQPTPSATAESRTDLKESAKSVFSALRNQLSDSDSESEDEQTPQQPTSSPGEPGPEPSVETPQEPAQSEVAESGHADSDEEMDDAALFGEDISSDDDDDDDAQVVKSSKADETLRGETGSTTMSEMFGDDMSDDDDDDEDAKDVQATADQSEKAQPSLASNETSTPSADDLDAIEEVFDEADLLDSEKREELLRVPFGKSKRHTLSVYEPESMSDELYSLKLPKGMRMEPEEWNSQAFDPSVDHAGTTAIRWRTGPTGDAQSNARLVRWSDGSMQMLVGGQYFDIHAQQLGQGDGSHYLFVESHTDANVKQCKGHFISRLIVQPSQVDSGMQQRHAAKISMNRARKNKLQTMKTTEKDADQEWKDLEMAEKAALKSETLRRAHSQRKRQANSSSSSRRRKNDYNGDAVGFLEEGQSSDEAHLSDSDGEAPSSKRRKTHDSAQDAARLRRAKQTNDDSSSEDHLDDDDDDQIVVRKTNTHRRTHALDDDDDSD